MRIYIDFNGIEACWEFYCFDNSKYKTTTSGFKTHIDAVRIAKERYGNEIKIIFK